MLIPIFLNIGYIVYNIANMTDMFSNWSLIPSMYYYAIPHLVVILISLAVSIVSYIFKKLYMVIAVILLYLFSIYLLPYNAYFIIFLIIGVLFCLMIYRMVKDDTKVVSDENDIEESYEDTYQKHI